MSVNFRTVTNKVDGCLVTEVTAECPDGQRIYKAFWSADPETVERWKLYIVSSYC